MRYDDEEARIFAGFVGDQKPEKTKTQQRRLRQRRQREPQQQKFNLVGALTSKEAKQGYAEAYKLTKSGATKGYVAARKGAWFLKKKLLKKKSIYD